MMTKGHGVTTYRELKPVCYGHYISLLVFNKDCRICKTFKSCKRKTKNEGNNNE